MEKGDYMDKLNIEYVDINSIQPYKNNAKKHPKNQIFIEEGIIEESPNVRSSWYQQLTQDFYIR